MTDLFTYKPAPKDPYFQTEVAKMAAEFDEQNPELYGVGIISPSEKDKLK